MKILKAYMTRWMQILPGGSRERCAFDLEDNPHLQARNARSEERLGIPALRFDSITERDQALEILRQYQRGALVTREDDDV